VLDFWPVTFAGSTTGNAVFATWLAQQFVASPGRYCNALDVVLHAWQELAWIEQSFPNGPRLPLGLKGLIKGIADILKVLKESYVQPGTGQSLPGTLQPGDNWFTEAGQQHASATYLNLVGAPLRHGVLYRPITPSPRRYQTHSRCHPPGVLVHADATVIPGL
jgi:hypothetical protein